MENNDKQSLDRRSFLKTGGIALGAGSAALLLGQGANAATRSIASDAPLEGAYKKFLNPKADIGTLTESAKQMVSRNQLLDKILANIPTPERAQQIFSILAKHIEAEEAGDTEATMATMTKAPIFESMPEGVSYVGHQNVMEDYARRYSGLTRKLHITNIVVDNNGASAEMIWEGFQKGSYKGLKPAKNNTKFFIPMVVYYEVSNDGLIQRESVYYDQYLGSLSLEILPDVLSHKAALVAINPKLLLRKG